MCDVRSRCTTCIPVARRAFASHDVQSRCSTLKHQYRPTVVVPDRSYQDGSPGAPGLLTALAGAAMVVVDVVVVYLLLATSGIPPIVSYGGTALVAAIVGGSFVAVLASRRGRGAPLAVDEPSAAGRVARVVVSITVLSGVTIVLGYGVGLLLWASATLGGPDPVTEDGDLLRDRLLEWPDRNRTFMRTNGHGELPLRP